MDAVDAQAKQFGIIGRKKFFLQSKSAHFCGANGSKICRMGEQYNPTSFVVF
jgi:hypothetical protein